MRDAVRAAEAGTQKKRREADSTDWMATQLTRRFGLAGGLAWVGFLAVGVIGEQVRGSDRQRLERVRCAVAHSTCAVHSQLLGAVPAALVGPVCRHACCLLH